MLVLQVTQIGKFGEAWDAHGGTYFSHCETLIGAGKAQQGCLKSGELDQRSVPTVTGYSSCVLIGMGSCLDVPARHENSGFISTSLIGPRRALVPFTNHLVPERIKDTLVLKQAISRLFSLLISQAAEVLYRIS